MKNTGVNNNARGSDGKARLAPGIISWSKEKGNNAKKESKKYFSQVRITIAIEESTMVIIASNGRFWENNTINMIKAENQKEKKPFT